MQANFDPSHHSEIVSKQSSWHLTIILTLAFWLSSSLFLDMLIMPSLYFTGMMAEPGFAGAGYSIFWLFNRVELICAGLVLTGLMGIRHQQTFLHQRGYIGVVLGSVLLGIALLYTYVLAPQMSALGMQLNLFTVAKVPGLMNQMQGAYWFLEMLKLAAGSMLLGLALRDRV